MTAARDPKLDAVLTASPTDAWQAVFEKLREAFSAPLSVQHAEREVMERERKVGELYETTEVPRDQMQKFLRGTGIAPSDFEERGWCSEKNKIFTLTPPVELARNWKGASRKGMARDFDQTMFLVGGCVEGSGIRVNDTLNSPNYAPHPAKVELVEWLCRHGGTPEIKHAAQRARTIYREWLAANKAKVEEQLKLFDLEG